MINVVMMVVIFILLMPVGYGVDYLRFKHRIAYLILGGILCVVFMGLLAEAYLTPQESSFLMVYSSPQGWLDLVSGIIGLQVGGYTYRRRMQP